MTPDGLVLVHGGYHGAWCWEAVRPLLTLPSVAVDLPGRGANPLGPRPLTFAACAEVVLAAADDARFERFVLVGHSLGGPTITETARRASERVAHLVYVAALLPPVGTTVGQLFGMPEVFEQADPAGLQPLMDEAAAHQAFAGDLDDEAFAAVHARCVPEAIGLFRDPVAGYGPVPATYLRCSRDQAVPPAMVEATLPNLAPVSVRTLDADHDVMVSNPALLAAELNAVVAGL